MTDLLLHTCCGPCSTVAVPAWRERGVEPVGWFENPNVQPAAELERRRESMSRFSRAAGLELVVGQGGEEAPGWGEWRERLAVAVDGELTTADAVLADGCEVALLPPVSGGSSDARAALVDLVDGPIDVAAVERSVAGPGCGAVVLFLGTVRNHHAGRAVERLTYSAYRPMALAGLRRIAGELEGAGSCRVGLVHRLGEVAVGEPSVVIAVASAHRQAAYEASRDALERLKREVPIWKREHYAGGDAAWREEERLVASGASA